MEDVEEPSDNEASIGVIDGNSYDASVMLELNRLTAKNRRKRSIDPGVNLFGYFGEDNMPDNNTKPKYYGNVKAKLTVKGLGSDNFQWSEIFGSDVAHLRFIQINDEARVPTGVERVLDITTGGEYTWTDGAGNPAELPLFDNNLKPLVYEVKLDEEVSEKVKLLTARIASTGNANTPIFTNMSDGRIKYDLTLELGLQQVASSKFVSEWHTAVVENERPQVQGAMTASKGSKSKTAVFNLPNNDTDFVKVRADGRKEGKKPDKIIVNFLYDKPSKVEVKTDTQGLTFDTENKTVKDANHKYKYDFTYDVLNGGKLTMTEIIPLTFDANGGKFDSITDPNAEQKIVKEVEYGKDLNEKVEIPRRDSHGFKGWGVKDSQDKLVAVTSEAFKNIKKATTFYAMWKKNKVSANELEVKESFKDGTKYVNDFIPTLEDIKAKVQIKDSNGVLQALKPTDTVEVLDDNKQVIAEADLKDKLYEKLKEDDTNETFKEVQIKVRVTRDNVKYPVTVKIKVYKNIYEAKTEEGRPDYVPADYVKVTVDPTTKAKDPQKYFYYVNPAAKVVIPGKDPVGTGENKFTKWLIKGTTDEYKLADKPRHMFTTATTIEAQYVSDVIPQEGDTKPAEVPENFVSVTFKPTDNATDKTDKIYWVNPEKDVTIPVEKPVGIDGFTFKEWKMGADAKGERYIPSTPKKFTDTNGTIITATYDKANNIIPYDPNSPITRPDGYIRVKFEADKGLELENVKFYYVKKNAVDAQNNPLTLKSIRDDLSLGYPGYRAATGYVFEKWDKEDSTEIKEADIVVTAKAKENADVIEKKPGVTKPEGYVDVKFVAGDNGQLKDGASVISEKIFYVNPKKYVTITNLPTTEGIGNYEFGAWDKDARIPTVYDKDTTITANFNEKGKVTTDPNQKGADDVTVTFKIDGKGGSIVKGQTSVYYVKPNVDISLNPPQILAETGYVFAGWDPDTTAKKQYTQDTVVKGTFTKLKDIIDGNEAKPDGYVTVTFVKGENGKSISGQTVYYVNPKAGKTLGDAEIKKPTVVADTGYIQKTIVKGGVNKPQWDTADSTEINEQSPKNITVKPVYEELKDVVPKFNDDNTENAKPEGYITVKFSTENNGKVKGTTDTTKVLYLNPDKALALDTFAPAVTPDTGFDFAGWDTQIDKRIQYDNNYTIKAKYNEKGDVIAQEKTDGSDKPAGYLTVTFDKGANGELDGKTVYYVKPNKKVTVPTPDVKPNVGYEFEKWDTDLTQTFTAENTTITAQYKPIADIVAKKNCDESDKPKGYVRVELAAVNGSLEGTTVYYVNPNKEVDFTETVKAVTKKADLGYTDEGGSWDKLKATFQEGDKVTFTFKALDDVIPENENGTTNKKPDGYITVKLIPTDKATDATKADKTYFVNPKEEVTIKNKPEGKKETVDGVEYTYVFKGWTVTRGTIADPWSSEEIKGTFKQYTEITANYNKELTAADLLAPPIAKKGAVTQINVEPKPEDLIQNVYDEKNQNDKTKLPKDTTFAYTNDGKPDVSKEGSTSATVLVKYPNGKTVTVVVPVTVLKSVDDIEYKPEDVIPFNPNELDDPTNPIKRPDGFIKVTFDADPGIKIIEPKAYYVRKEAKDKKGNPLKVSALPKPKFETAQGYAFDNKWDDDTKTIGTKDIILTAKARKTYSECTPDYRPDDRPDYETRYKYRDRIVEKEKIVEKIVKVGSDDMLKEIRYMQGFEGKFRPYDGLRRCEAAQILANALKADGYRYNEHYALSYTDVGNEWYTDAIRVVTQAGVFTGYNDGTFKPNGKITRAEWISTLRRFQNLRVEAGNLMNLKPGHWASGEVGAALMAGWLEIYVNGTVNFDADAPITRQEVAAVSNKAFRRVLDKVYLRRSVNTLLNYKDINPSMPLYEDILCASNTLLTDGRYYKANTIVMDNVTFNIVTDLLKITQKKFQYNGLR